MDKIIPYLVNQATKSNMSIRLSSCILTNKSKPLAICNNSDRSLLRGIVCCSAHSEINSILRYYGKTLTRNKDGWCILQG
jgi:hypothetical protein